MPRSELRHCPACKASYNGSTSQCLRCLMLGSPESVAAASPQSPPAKNRAARRAVEKEQAQAAKKLVSKRATLPTPAPQPPSRSPQETDRLVRESTRIPSVSARCKDGRSRCGGKGAVCQLCGQLVPPGKLLEHKEREHGERAIVPSPAQPRKDVWVPVCSGGLPSLGKKGR